MFRKLLLISIIILSSAIVLQAQENERHWDEGKISWNDFSEASGISGVSEIRYFLAYKPVKIKRNDSSFLLEKAYCFMDTRLSWVNPEFKNPLLLKYNQLVFDIVELHRRILQYELNRSTSFFEKQSRFRKIYNDCSAMIEKYKAESGEGRYPGIITQWEERISEQLRLNRDEDEIPDIIKRNFGYGMHLGFGGGITTSSLSNTFKPSFNFIFGFDLAYKRKILFLNGTLAGSDVKADYMADKNWYKGQRAHLAVIDVSLGYAFVDNAKLKLTPFAGLGITEFSGENKDMEEDELRIVDYNILFGLNADYKLNTRINTRPAYFSGLSESMETSVRARLYISKAHYYDDLKGYTINLTLGICGFGNIIRLK